MKNRAISLFRNGQAGILTAAAISVVILSFAGTFAFASIVYQSSQTDGSTEVTYTSITVNKPTSVASGDLMLASIAVNGGDLAVISLAPSGWTLIGSTTNDSKLLLLSYYKIAGGSEGSSYEWRVNGSRTGAGGITRYTGVDTSNPIDAHDGNGNFGLGITATTSVITTTVASSTIVTLFAVDEGKPSVGSYFDEVTGMTERYERKGTDVGPTIALDDAVQGAVGSVSSKTSAIGGSNKPKNWASQVIALRPASSGNIAFDNSGFVAEGGNYTVGTSTSGGTLVILNWEDGTNAEPATAPTIGGTSAQFLARFATNGPNYIHVYYLSNVSPGTVVVNANSGIGADLMSYLNVSASSPIDNSITSGAASSLTLNVNTTDSWLWCVWDRYGAPIGMNAGPCSYRYGAATGKGQGDSNGPLSVGSYTQTWDQTGGVGLISIKPAP